MEEVQRESAENFVRQRSQRRVLPEDHRANLFGRQNEDLNKMYKLFRQEYIILAEYKMVQSERIPGIYVIPSRENSFEWFGVMFVRNGLYDNGIFRFKIILDEHFPASEHPKIVFETEIIHPMVYPDSNELSLLYGFPTWDKNKQHIWQILKYMNWIFENIDASLEQAVNVAIVDMYKNKKEALKTKISEIVMKSQERIYDEPPTEDKHYITFKPYDVKIHDQVKYSMLNYRSEKPTSKGCSWVLPGSCKPLEKIDKIMSLDSQNES